MSAPRPPAASPAAVFVGSPRRRGRGWATLGTRFEDTLLGARQGAPWACRALYDDLAGQVLGYLRLQGLGHDAEDVCSEVFLDVFRGLPRFRGDEAGFRSWVFTIAHRRWVDEVRRRSRRPPTVALAAATPAVDGVDVARLGTGVALAGRLGRYLRELTDEQRTVLLLRMVADLPVETTAAVMGKRVGAVKMLQRRALASMRRVLERDGVTAIEVL